MNKWAWETNWVSAVDKKRLLWDHYLHCLWLAIGEGSGALPKLSSQTRQFGHLWCQLIIQPKDTSHKSAEKTDAKHPQQPRAYSASQTGDRKPVWRGATMLKRDWGNWAKIKRQSIANWGAKGNTELANKRAKNYHRKSAAKNQR